MLVRHLQQCGHDSCHQGCSLVSMPQVDPLTSRLAGGVLQQQRAGYWLLVAEGQISTQSTQLWTMPGSGAAWYKSPTLQGT